MLRLFINFTIFTKFSFSINLISFFSSEVVFLEFLYVHARLVFRSLHFRISTKLILSPNLLISETISVIVSKTKGKRSQINDCLGNIKVQSRILVSPFRKGVKFFSYFSN